MDPDDHGLLGYSAGGAFVTYALFARPGAFAKYICGSAGLYAGDNAIFDLEEKYAADTTTTSLRTSSSPPATERSTSR
jgi:predicted alpha/beta superfamily hydrolase